MARANHTPLLADTEEALTLLFCLIDDAYALLNPNAKRYEPLKRLLPTRSSSRSHSSSS